MNGWIGLKQYTCSGVNRILIKMENDICICDLSNKATNVTVNHHMIFAFLPFFNFDWNLFLLFVYFVCTFSKHIYAMIETHYTLVYRMSLRANNCTIDLARILWQSIGHTHSPHLPVHNILKLFKFARVFRGKIRFAGTLFRNFGKYSIFLGVQAETLNFFCLEPHLNSLVNPLGFGRSFRIVFKRKKAHQTIC